ncbi:hypothetical protein HRG_010642 [Hirsutella rhossiliensis]|uniref:GPI anchored serine-threonine rich protein n=1 Tax=Hirsutella rhossiliensis TaxID=111463 RepID=A0A9P8SES8_9HYPO|nr:uncharacterized protein HRG_10642 [Hirsutella rhossiliensis]KAH0958341.1 hypothetical protein HRG_10642 [Hirsutella rhossiliensis]
MKFLVPLTLLVAAGVSAKDQACKADYIVTSCLRSETAKVQECKTTDYDCLCAAYEAVATCYNNCPDDIRAPDAHSQVTNFCQNASIYGSRALASKTAASRASRSTSSAVTTTDSATLTEAASASATSASRSASTGAAEARSANAGGLLMAAAGLVAALL